MKKHNLAQKTQARRKATSFAKYSATGTSSARFGARRNRKGYPGFHAYDLVAILLLIGGVILFVGHQTKLKEIAESKLTVYAQQVQVEASKSAQLEQENNDLKAHLDFSAKIVTSDTTKKLSVYYIHKYFPQSAWKDVQATMTCESNLNNLSTNFHNRDGSIDRGMYMINSVHAKQFKQVTGIDYEVGAYDWDASSKFARFLYDHSGLNPWVCYQIVRNK